MKNVAYILSYDVGTGGTKCVLVGLGGGIYGMATESYGLIQPHTGWAEQDPEWYWQACCKATQRVLKESGVSPKGALGMVFATQWKGMIPLDKSGAVLHNSIVWLDTRATEQAARLSQRLGRAASPRDYWPRVMWFRDNYPELYDRTVCILEANGYLKYRACGERFTDIANNFIRSPKACVQSIFDEILDAAQLDASLFPPLIAPYEKAGELTAEAAEQMGLLPGVPVFGGLHDLSAVTVGSGAGSLGAAHVYLGSSGWIGMVRSMDDSPPGIPIMLDDAHYVHIAGMQSVGMTYDWCIHKTFYPAESAHMGAGVYGFVEDELAAVPPGSCGLMAMPLQHGESSPFPASMRACYFGIDAAHTRAHMVNATLEGICYMLRLRKQTVENSAGRKLTSISAVGGGSASAHWMQMLSDILGLEINVPANARYAGALGAAYCAMMGLGVCSGFDECATRMRIQARYAPQSDVRQAYENGFNAWQRCAEGAISAYKQ